jgi:serine/threonine protein kinase
MNEREIFERAIEIDDRRERDAFLDQACGADLDLRRRLDELLMSRDQVGDLRRVPGDQTVVPPQESDSFATIAAPADSEWKGRHPSVYDEEDESENTNFSFLQLATQSDSIGRLGHYEILKVLGRGAFGIVFKAFDQKLHRLVAIKVMSPELALTSPPRKRFLREARSVAALKHENVIQIYSVEE